MTMPRYLNRQRSGRSLELGCGTETNATTIKTATNPSSFQGLSKKEQFLMQQSKQESFTSTTSIATDIMEPILVASAWSLPELESTSPMDTTKNLNNTTIKSMTGRLSPPMLATNSLVTSTPPLSSSKSSLLRRTKKGSVTTNATSSMSTSSPTGDDSSATTTKVSRIAPLSSPFKTRRKMGIPRSSSSHTTSKPRLSDFLDKTDSISSSTTTKDAPPSSPRRKGSLLQLSSSGVSTNHHPTMSTTTSSRLPPLRRGVSRSSSRSLTDLQDLEKEQEEQETLRSMQQAVQRERHQAPHKKGPQHQQQSSPSMNSNSNRRPPLPARRASLLADRRAQFSASRGSRALVSTRMLECLVDAYEKIFNADDNDNDTDHEHNTHSTREDKKEQDQNQGKAASPAITTNKLPPAYPQPSKAIPPSSTTRPRPLHRSSSLILPRNVTDIANTSAPSSSSHDMGVLTKNKIPNQAESSRPPLRGGRRHRAAPTRSSSMVVGEELLSQYDRIIQEYDTDDDDNMPQTPKTKTMPARLVRQRPPSPLVLAPSTTSTPGTVAPSVPLA